MKTITLFLSTLIFTTYSQTAQERFGVHLGSLDYYSATPFISQLGSHIYVRNEVFHDEEGWRQIKSTASSSDCIDYCDSTKGPCTCMITNSFYYRKPPNRNGLLTAPILIDFYNNNYNYNQFVNFYTSRYDSSPPTQYTDLIAAYPNGAESIYRDYVKFLVDSFSDKVKYWEVGNENNDTAFWAGTPLEYANMLKLASHEIKQSCSDCKVAISFSAFRPGKKWYAALPAVVDTFDVIDVHMAASRPFIQPGDLDSLKKYCPGKTFISTETGLSDTILPPPGAGKPKNAGGTPVKQAQDLVKGNTLMFDEGYSAIYWYLVDTDYGPDDIFLHNALIDDIGAAPKPAFTSYKTMISKVDSFTTLTKITTGQYKYDFTNKGSVYVLWCDTGTSSLPTAITGTVTVTDYMGNAQVKQASQVVLDSLPIYVELGVVASSVNEGNDLPGNISVYPNPAYTTITVSIPSGGKSESDSYRIQISDLLGQVMIKENDHHQIDISSLANGVYIISVRQGQNNFVQRFIKQ